MMKTNQMEKSRKKWFEAVKSIACAYKCYLTMLIQNVENDRKIIRNVTKYLKSTKLNDQWPIITTTITQPKRENEHVYERENKQLKCYYSLLIQIVNMFLLSTCMILCPLQHTNLTQILILVWQHVFHFHV